MIHKTNISQKLLALQKKVVQNQRKNVALVLGVKFAYTNMIKNKENLSIILSLIRIWPQNLIYNTSYVLPGQTAGSC